jgi:Leucine-rich repeat (LRR) protein
MDNDAVWQINRLGRLTSLVVADTNITGKGLIQLDRLRQLEVLDASQLKEIPVVLRVLRGSRALTDLSLDDCSLTDADLQDISHMRSLTSLNLNHSPISNTSLKRLSALTELQSLGLSGKYVQAESIDVLQSFKKLKKLRIDLIDWTPADRLRLQQALPANCEIIDGSKHASLQSFLTDK